MEFTCYEIDTLLLLKIREDSYLMSSQASNPSLPGTGMPSQSDCFILFSCGSFTSHSSGFTYKSHCDCASDKRNCHKPHLLKNVSTFWRGKQAFHFIKSLKKEKRSLINNSEKKCFESGSTISVHCNHKGSTMFTLPLFRYSGTLLPVQKSDSHFISISLSTCHAYICLHILSMPCPYSGSFFFFSHICSTVSPHFPHPPTQSAPEKITDKGTGV